MSSYFYIKLFHEILHDPKMGRLTDNLWRRVIEVFLLAGENGHNGDLPAIEDMAWELRLSVEELESNLQALAKYDIVSLTPTGWHVTHFEKRQAPIDGKDRVSGFRDRAKKQAYYATETEETQQSNDGVTTRYTELDIELDIEKSKSKKLSAEKTPRKTPAPIPAGVTAYREAAHRYPNKSLYGLIDEHVGSEPDRVNFWREVVVRYIALGWNPNNISGQLEWFDRRELPSKNGKGGNSKNGNGNSAEPSSPMLRAIARREGKLT